MTVHPMQRTDSRVALLLELWQLSSISIGSWALEVDSTPAPSMTVIAWDEGDLNREYDIDLPLIARALRQIATSGARGLHPADQEALLEARREDTADRLNRRQASALVQVGLFGEVRYPDRN